MSVKFIRISGRVLTAVLAILLGFSAFMKISLSSMALSQAASIGIDPGMCRIIGWAELVSLILFIFPRTGMLGSLLLIAYMGGAIATHLQHQQPVTVPVIVQVLIWVSAFLRYPEIIHRVFPSFGNNVSGR